MYANGYFVLLPLAIKHDMSKLQYTSFGFIFVMQGKMKNVFAIFPSYWVFHTYSIDGVVRHHHTKSNSINGMIFFMPFIPLHHI